MVLCCGTIRALAGFRRHEEQVTVEFTLSPEVRELRRKATAFMDEHIYANEPDRAIQVHGARGVSEDTPLASIYRAARAARIYDGPDEVHRTVVARRILRMFKDGPTWEFE